MLRSLKALDIPDEFKGPIWHSYFKNSIKKDENLEDILRKVISYFQMHYPFLEQKQILGKAYSFLNIPNLCGQVDRKRLYQLYLRSRKNEIPVKKKLHSSKLVLKNTSLSKPAHKPILKTIVKKNTMINTLQNSKPLEEKLKRTNSLVNIHKYVLKDVNTKSRKSVRFVEGVEIFNISPAVQTPKEGNPEVQNKNVEVNKQELVVPPKKDICFDSDSDSNHDADTYFDSDMDISDESSDKISHTQDSNLKNENIKDANKSIFNWMNDWVGEKSVNDSLKKIDLLKNKTLHKVDEKYPGEIKNIVAEEVNINSKGCHMEENKTENNNSLNGDTLLLNKDNRTHKQFYDSHEIKKAQNRIFTSQKNTEVDNKSSRTIYNVQIEKPKKHENDKINEYAFEKECHNLPDWIKHRDKQNQEQDFRTKNKKSYEKQKVLNKCSKKDILETEGEEKNITVAKENATENRESLDWIKDWDSPNSKDLTPKVNTFTMNSDQKVDKLKSVSEKTEVLIKKNANHNHDSSDWIKNCGTQTQEKKLTPTSITATVGSDNQINELQKTGSAREVQTERVNLKEGILVENELFERLEETQIIQKKNVNEKKSSDKEDCIIDRSFESGSQVGQSEGSPSTNQRTDINILENNRIVKNNYSKPELNISLKIFNSNLELIQSNVALIQHSNIENQIMVGSVSWSLIENEQNENGFRNVNEIREKLISESTTWIEDWDSEVESDAPNTQLSKDLSMPDQNQYVTHNTTPVLSDPSIIEVSLSENYRSQKGKDSVQIDSATIDDDNLKNSASVLCDTDSEPADTERKSPKSNELIEKIDSKADSGSLIDGTFIENNNNKLKLSTYKKKLENITRDISQTVVSYNEIESSQSPYNISYSSVSMISSLDDTISELSNVTLSIESDNLSTCYETDVDGKKIIRCKRLHHPSFKIRCNENKNINQIFKKTNSMENQQVSTNKELDEFIPLLSKTHPIDDSHTKEFKPGRFDQTSINSGDFSLTNYFEKIVKKNLLDKELMDKSLQHEMNSLKSTETLLNEIDTNNKGIELLEKVKLSSEAPLMLRENKDEKLFTFGQCVDIPASENIAKISKSSKSPIIKIQNTKDVKNVNSFNDSEPDLKLNYDEENTSPVCTQKSSSSSILMSSDAVTQENEKPSKKIRKKRGQLLKLRGTVMIESTSPESDTDRKDFKTGKRKQIFKILPDLDLNDLGKRCKVSKDEIDNVIIKTENNTLSLHNTSIMSHVSDIIRIDTDKKEAQKIKYEFDFNKIQETKLFNNDEFTQLLQPTTSGQAKSMDHDPELTTQVPSHIKMEQENVSFLRDGLLCPKLKNENIFDKVRISQSILNSNNQPFLDAEIKDENINNTKTHIVNTEIDVSGNSDFENLICNIKTEDFLDDNKKLNDENLPKISSHSSYFKSDSLNSEDEDMLVTKEEIISPSSQTEYSLSQSQFKKNKVESIKNKSRYLVETLGSPHLNRSSISYFREENLNAKTNSGESKQSNETEHNILDSIENTDAEMKRYTKSSVVRQFNVDPNQVSTDSQNLYRRSFFMGQNSTL